MSTIQITHDGTDITHLVVLKESTFESQANPMQGSFKIVLRDLDQSFTPSIGKKMRLIVDGTPLFGGYIMRVSRGNFFPAVDTTVPTSVQTRRWILSGPDYNVLFDKRVLYDAANYASELSVPDGKRTISKAFKYLVANYVDIPSGLDVTTNIDTISAAYGTNKNGGLYVGQSRTWREQMDDFADHAGIIYYIDADFSVHLHEYETMRCPWAFVDSHPNGTTTIGFREGDYNEDFSQIVTEALVWGGSSIRKSDGGTGGDVVFSKYPSGAANNVKIWEGTESERWLTKKREQDAIDRRNLYGRWQVGEEHAGQNNYLSEDSVKTRAYVIVNGPTGTPPTYGIEGGYNKPLETMTCTWFDVDVPGGQHVRPGMLTDFILYTQGHGGNPKVTTLPLRSVRISFPTKPDTANTSYIRFDGEFGVSYSDSRFLWKAIRKQRRTLRSTYPVIADGTAASTPAGAYGRFEPIQTPDGSRKTFTFENASGGQVGLLAGQFQLFLNGLMQRINIDYQYNSEAMNITFVVAPDVGDQIYVTGYVTG